ncbi:MAG: glycoside hydrolase family 16 protein [Bacteroidales bacterium]|nr:glycoside hydrolase family 16 protein [Bacteroidales bacterium]
MDKRHLILPTLIAFISFSLSDGNNAFSQKIYTPEKLGYKLVWEDNFNGKSLDTTQWNVRGIGPRRLGYISEKAVKVEDGFLKLYALQNGDSILSGAVGTGHHFNPTYGYFECRAQLQKSSGVWAAFWLQSSLISQGSDPGKFGTEVDIFEFFKEVGKDTVQHALHWAYGPDMRSVGPMNSYLEGLSEGFHTFALEWTPRKYVFYIDGRKFFTQKQGISHIGEYIILSMELPDKPEQVKHTVFPDVFIVDYVKVYQK